MRPFGRDTLDYGRPETQWGVTVEHTPDGGVVITVPAGLGNRPGEFAVAVMEFLARVLPAWLAKPPPPRAVVRLTSEGLNITEAHDESAGATVTREWPLDEVGEIRLNRYGPGLYVRIPGKDNFDALDDLDPRLLELMSRELQAALSRLRPDGP